MEHSGSCVSRLDPLLAVQLLARLDGSCNYVFLRAFLRYLGLAFPTSLLLGWVLTLWFPIRWFPIRLPVLYLVLLESLDMVSSSPLSPLVVGVLDPKLKMAVSFGLQIGLPLLPLWFLGRSVPTAQVAVSLYALALSACLRPPTLGIGCLAGRMVLRPYGQASCLAGQ